MPVHHVPVAYTESRVLRWWFYKLSCIVWLQPHKYDYRHCAWFGSTGSQSYRRRNQGRILWSSFWGQLRRHILCCQRNTQSAAEVWHTWQWLPSKNQGWFRSWVSNMEHTTPPLPRSIFGLVSYLPGHSVIRIHNVSTHGLSTYSYSSCSLYGYYNY